MDDKIITGVITNMDTGEKTEMEHYALFPHYEMTTIVLVKGVESYETEQDNGIQINVTCKALDSIGMVCDLEIIFTPETSEDKATILSDMAKDSVYLMNGQYSFVKNELITLHDPEYRSVEPDFKEDEVREAFRINEKHKRCQ